MKKHHQDRVVGCLEHVVAMKWHIYEHSSKKIIIPFYLYDHAKKHRHEYFNEESYLFTLKNIGLILKYPDYVFYDHHKRGLEYYKKLIENVCIVVKISGEELLSVVSIYPVSESKIQNRKNREQVLAT